MIWGASAFIAGTTSLSWLIVLVALSIGFGVSFGSAYWIATLVEEQAEDAIRILIAAPCISAVLGFFTRLLGSSSVRVYVLVLLFALSVFLMMTTTRAGTKEPAAYGLTRFSIAFGGVVTRTWKAALFIAVFGFASGAMRAISVPERALEFNASIALSILIGTSIYYLVSRYVDGGFNSMPARIAMLLCAATIFLSLPFTADRYWILLLGVIDVLYMCLSIYMNVTAVSTSKVGSLSPVATIAFLKGVVFLFVALGFLANRALRVSIGGDSTGPLVLALITVYLVILVIVPLVSKRGGVSASASTGIAGVLLDISESDIRGNDALKKTYGLTTREIDVLLLLLAGRGSSSIADALYISDNTVRTHLKRIYGKLGVHNREEVRDLVQHEIAKG
ncbi:MAG: helix-turn-helix transcriptional regulator [Coriobacteriia bacterium]|nr:helix-turn-helix transcriptional regulator [Coriobacteriia bacterium]